MPLSCRRSDHIATREVTEFSNLGWTPIIVQVHDTGPLAMTARDHLALELEDDLVRRYGMLLPSSALVSILGYKSMTAYQQAVARRTLPVPVFEIEKRRGRFALAKDVARWMSEQRGRALLPDGQADTATP